MKLYQRQPKIKPNYHTKAGGMLACAAGEPKDHDASMSCHRPLTSRNRAAAIKDTVKKIVSKPEEEKVEESKGGHQRKIQLEPPEESKELLSKTRSKSLTGSGNTKAKLADNESRSKSGSGKSLSVDRNHCKLGVKM